jgi:hypothetical protein
VPTLIAWFPPPWPDEALFAAPAAELIRGGPLGSDILGPALPGADRHAYWMPPLYFLLVAGSFAVAGVGLLAMRSLSLALGLGVLLLNDRLAHTLGLGPAWRAALIPLLALDWIFLRGAMVGRVDMLTLSLLMLVLWSAQRARTSQSHAPPWAALCGGAAAASLLCHPLGIAGPVVAAVAWLQGCARRRRTAVAGLIAAALVLLPALLWVLDDPQSWLDQLGAQLARKADRDPLTSLTAGLAMMLDQYPQSAALVLLLWLLGLVGLGAQARRAGGAWGPFAAQLALTAALLWSQEMWYPLLLAPLSLLGTALLWDHLPRGSAAGLTLRVGLVGLLLTGLGQSGGQLLLEARDAHQAQRNEGDYQAWCDAIAARIPAGSVVMIGAIPDPWLGLQRHTQLELREFSPIPLDEKGWEASLEDVDHVIIGARCPSLELWAWTQDNAVMITQVGAPQGRRRVGIFERRPRPPSAPASP